MSGWGITNLVDPHIEKHGNTIEVNVAPGDVIDNNDAIYWIAPQHYRGNKVCTFLCLSVCLCFCYMNKNLIISFIRYCYWCDR